MNKFWMSFWGRVYLRFMGSLVFFLGFVGAVETVVTKSATNEWSSALLMLMGAVGLAIALSVSDLKNL